MISEFHCTLEGHFYVNLSSISPRDAVWDKFRGQVDGFRDLYKETIFDSYVARMGECSGYLKFSQLVDLETGETKLRLDKGSFCRVPRCPVCQWRRQLMWRAKTFKVMPLIMEEYPDARFIFLTLTIKNCHIDDLREALTLMNKAWNRLTNRNTFPAIGWIKAVEVTRNHDDDTAHPHFHVLLMVKPGYFTGKYYISQQKWTEMWKQSLGVNYNPVVDVRAVKTTGKATQENLQHVLELIKYSVKPEDILTPQKDGASNIDKDKAWLVGLTKALYKMRLISTGGVLRKYLAELEKEPEDLIHSDDLPEDEGAKKSIDILFIWFSHISKYSTYAWTANPSD